jgi:hypothetical protein
MLHEKWWKMSPLQRCGWMFWNDPFTEIRISTVQMHAAKNSHPSAKNDGIIESTRYWIWNPQNLSLLSEWQRAGNGESYMTESKEVAQKTLDAMGLPMPIWEKNNNNHCYRHYWREPVYYI